MHSASTPAAHRSPRPCLKHSLNTSPVHSPSHDSHPASHVHFPPSPSLSTTFLTHSKRTYDRRPLVVAPNSCALPARGCPGRTYVLDRAAQVRFEEDNGSLSSSSSSSSLSSDMRRCLEELPFPPSPRGTMALPVSTLSPLAPPSPSSGAQAPVSDRGQSSSSSESESERRQRAVRRYVPEREQEREERRRRRSEGNERARWKAAPVDDMASGAFGGF